MSRSYKTNSSDVDLNGHEGSVRCVEPPESYLRGRSRVGTITSFMQMDLLGLSSVNVCPAIGRRRANGWKPSAALIGP
jgi:hypothetical protein